MKKIFIHFKVIHMMKEYEENREFLVNSFDEGEDLPVTLRETTNGIFEVLLEKKPVGRVMFELSKKEQKINDYEGGDQETLRKILLKNYDARIVERKGLLYTVLIDELENVKEKNQDWEVKTFESEKKRVLEFVRPEDLQKRLDYMSSMNFNEELMTEVLSIYEPDDEVTEPKTLFKEKKPGDDDFLVKNMIEDILDGHNILLEGPKSTGKNVAWETVAWLLNMKICVQKISTQTTNDDVLGSMSTDNSVGEYITPEAVENLLMDLSLIMKGECSPSKESIGLILDKIKLSGTHLKFNPGILTKILLRGRGIFIFDEMDMGTANFLSSIVNTLGDDHSKYFEVPGFGEIPIPEHVIFGATQNGSEYIGTQPQNDATMSRFTKYIIQNPASIKHILKEANGGLHASVYNQLDKIYSALREEVNEGTISDTCLNIRGFKRAIDNIARGKSIDKALERNVVNICDADEREVIKSVIEIAL